MKGKDLGDNKIKVSIIVPVYNVEAYIEKCICSVLSQSYINFEIILVDDGSKDKSLSICKAYEKRDSRIKVISKLNEGVSMARNCGIEACKGEFIIFIDADDWIERDYIQNMMRHVSATSDLWISNYTLDDVGHSVRRDSFTDEFTIFNEQDIVALKKICLIPSYHFCSYSRSKFFLAGVWGKVFRTSIIKNNDICFIKELKISEDVMFLLTYLERCHGVTFFHEYGYHYVVRKMSAMHIYKKELFENHVAYIDKLNEEVSKQKLHCISMTIVSAVAIRTLYTYMANNFFWEVFEGNVKAAERYINIIIEKKLDKYISVKNIPFIGLRHKIMLIFVKYNKSGEFLKLMKLKTKFCK